MPHHNFFDRNKPISIEDIAEKIGARLQKGSADSMISDVGSLESAQAGDITFVMSPKYKKHLEATKASACILDDSSAKDAPTHLHLLVHPNPHEAFAAVCLMLYPERTPTEFRSDKCSIAKTAKIGANVHISDFAVIEDGATLGDNVYIGPNVTISKNVSIGAGSIIYSNVSISHAKLGNNCIIHTGVRIGQDGFGYAQTQRGLLKVKQLGAVIIGNNVEIGSNTCIDRGAIEDTIIGDGTKIDNLVQIGHNTVIGRNCVICGQVGLAGSSVVEDLVMLGGQAGVAGHLRIGAGSMIAARGGVMSDIPPKSIMGGSPVVPIRDWHKGNAIMKKLINSNKSGGENDKSSK